MMLIFPACDVLACNCELWKEGVMFTRRLRVSHWEALVESLVPKATVVRSDGAPPDWDVGPIFHAKEK